MPNSPDFRSDQIQVNKLIVSGANAGSAECLLVYPLSAQGTPANQGNINPAIFDTSPIGSDAFFYVSGSVGGKGGSTPTIAVFGGDLHVSGNLSVDGSGASGGSAQIWFSDISGSTYSTGSVQIRNEFVGEISLVVTGSSVIAGIGSYATGSSVASGEETVASGLCSHSEGQYGVASGDYSHSEGYNSTASGNHSHAEGFATTASGAGGHSEGDGTLASGINSHAEGRMATSSGLGSHAEGTMTIASGDYSHAEGRMTRAHADYNHAEGEGAEAFGVGSHAEGFETNAIGNWSHAEGSYTDTPGDFSHASGIRTIASGSGQNVVGKYNLRNNDFSLFVVGNGTDDDDFLRSDIFRVNDTSVEVTGSFISSKITGSLSGTVDGSPFLIGGPGITTVYNTNGQWEISGSSGGTSLWSEINSTIIYTTSSIEIAKLSASLGAEITGSVTQGIRNIASGDNSHAEGQDTIASSQATHAEGSSTQASGFFSHAEGVFTTAAAYAAHAEGYFAKSNALGGHAEGFFSTANGNFSHAEGNGTTTGAEHSHAEGVGSSTNGSYSHAEGYYTLTNGPASHTTGWQTIANGSGSFAAGLGTIAEGETAGNLDPTTTQAAFGKFNIQDASSLFVVGDGDSSFNRHDVFRVASGSVQVTGSFEVFGGITGSLNTTTNGNPFLTGSSGITANYNTIGQWELSASSKIPILAGVVTTTLSASTIAGYALFTDLNSPSYTLEGIGFASVAGVTGSVELYDLVNSSSLSSLSWTETTPTHKTASFVATGSSRVLELRVNKSGGGISDYALFSAVFFG
jgi:hypothetical protein